MIFVKTKLSFHFKKREFITFDNFSSTIYECQCKRKKTENTVIVFNPPNVEVGLVAPLLEELSEFFNVITWESRGVSLQANQPQINKENSSVSTHLRDVRDILLSCNGAWKTGHIIGYCSGGILALIAVSQISELDVKSISIISSPFCFVGVKKHKRLDDIIAISGEIINKGVPFAKKIVESFNCREALESDELDKINQAPYRDIRATLMYSFFLDDLYRYSHEDIIGNIEENILFLNVKNDEYVHFDTQNYLLELIPSAHFVVLPSGGHFIFHKDFYAIEEILSFIWMNSD